MFLCRNRGIGLYTVWYIPTQLSSTAATLETLLDILFTRRCDA